MAFDIERLQPHSALCQRHVKTVMSWMDGFSDSPGSMKVFDAETLEPMPKGQYEGATRGATFLGLPCDGTLPEPIESLRGNST